MSHDASKRYDKEKKEFIRKNSKGDENEFSETKTVEGHNEFTLVWNSENGSKPAKASFALLMFLDLIMMGWI